MSSLVDFGALKRPYAYSRTDFAAMAVTIVVTDPESLSLRFDERLYLSNARFLEDLINDAVAANPRVRHVILECRQ